MQVLLYSYYINLWWFGVIIVIHFGIKIETHVTIRTWHGSVFNNNNNIIIL